MKLKWKQALSALLAIALMLSFAGCAKGASNTASSSNATSSDAAYTDEELAQVAVKVGDEYTITKGDILDEYDYMVQMYSYYGMSAPSTDEEIEAMQDSVIATLVSDKVQLYQAKLMGITLTDEEQADAEAQTEEQIQYYLDSFRDQATSEGATDVEARALEIFQEQLDAYDMNMDLDGYRAFVLENYENVALKAALKAKITEGVTATDCEKLITLCQPASVAAAAADTSPPARANTTSLARTPGAAGASTAAPTEEAFRFLTQRMHVPKMSAIICVQSRELRMPPEA